MTARWSALILAVATASVAGCGDATAPAERIEGTYVIGVSGLTADWSGLVLQVRGEVIGVAPADESIELAWSSDASAARIALVGSITNDRQLIRIHGLQTDGTLEISIEELASLDGTVSVAPATARTVVVFLPQQSE
jgi:hypothetical protein